MQKAIESRQLVVAGNGPSLARIDPGRVLLSDAIVRVNSFFFEPQYYLSKRVDLAFVSGDPRVVPFMLATLKKELSKRNYYLRSWCATHPKTHRVSARLLREWPETRIPNTSEDLQRKLDTLMARYQAKPTSGVQAAFAAQALGADRIILAGIDLYQGERRYVFTSGANQELLLGDAVHAPSYDQKLHSRDLDCAALDLLQNNGVRLTCASEDTALNDFIDLAPHRLGTPVSPVVRDDTPTDWASWAGIYPIQLLAALRNLRKFKELLFPR